MRSKAWVCGRWLVGSAGSNPAKGMDVCLLWVLCIIRQRSLQQADHSSRGALPTVVGLSVIVQPRQRGRPGPLGTAAAWTIKSAWSHEATSNADCRSTCTKHARWFNPNLASSLYPCNCQTGTAITHHNSTHRCSQYRCTALSVDSHVLCYTAVSP